MSMAARFWSRFKLIQTNQHRNQKLTLSTIRFWYPKQICMVNQSQTKTEIWLWFRNLIFKAPQPECQKGQPQNREQLCVILAGLIQ